jgi:hypothetical protein
VAAADVSGFAVFEVKANSLLFYNGQPVDLFLRRRNSSEGSVAGVNVPAMA